MNYAFSLIHCTPRNNLEAYLAGKIVAITGMTEVEDLASGVANYGDANPDNFALLGANADAGVANATNEGDVRDAMACILRQVRSHPDLLEEGEEILATDFAVYTGDSPTLPRHCAGLRVTTNMADFVVLDPEFIFPLDTGIATDLTLSALKGLAGYLGEKMGCALLKKIGLDKQISLDELRRQIAGDMEQKNIEQTLREQRGLVMAAQWDLAFFYYDCKSAETKLKFLLDRQKTLSEVVSTLSDPLHRAPGAVEYFTACGLFLITIQEFIKVQGGNYAQSSAYKDALRRAIEPAQDIKGRLDAKRMKYVHGAHYERYNCAQSRGDVICSTRYWWRDDKTGHTGYTYPQKSDGKNGTENRSNGEKETYKKGLCNETNWILDIKAAWEDELRRVGG